MRTVRLGDNAPILFNLMVPMSYETMTPSLAQTLRAATAQAAAAGGGEDVPLAAHPNAEQCRCMLDSVPALAGDRALYEQGLQACVADPPAFATQMGAAGYPTAACTGAGATPWYRTTPGMIGIGVGALALFGGLALAVSR